MRQEAFKKFIRWHTWNKQKEGNVSSLETLDLSVNKTSQIVCMCAKVSHGQVCHVQFSFHSTPGDLLSEDTWAHELEPRTLRLG